MSIYHYTYFQKYNEFFDNLLQDLQNLFKYLHWRQR